MLKAQIQHWKPQTLAQRWPLTPKQSQALLYSQSLTAKLRQSCPQLEVQVLSENFERPLAQEAFALGLPPNQRAWVRCVLLHCDQQPLIYARTIIPYLVPGNPWYVLKKLGNQPLGEVLFKLKNTQRSAFKVLKITRPGYFYLPHAFQTALNQKGQTSFWGRQSLFTQFNARLLLTEVFLQLPS